MISTQAQRSSPCHACGRTGSDDGHWVKHRHALNPPPPPSSLWPACSGPPFFGMFAPPSPSCPQPDYISNPENKEIPFGAIPFPPHQKTSFSSGSKPSEIISRGNTIQASASQKFCIFQNFLFLSANTPANPNRWFYFFERGWNSVSPFPVLPAAVPSSHAAVPQPVTQYAPALTAPIFAPPPSLPQAAAPAPAAPEAPGRAPRAPRPAACGAAASGVGPPAEAAPPIHACLPQPRDGLLKGAAEFEPGPGRGTPPSVLVLGVTSSHPLELECNPFRESTPHDSLGSVRWSD